MNVKHDVTGSIKCICKVLGLDGTLEDLLFWVLWKHF